jgi:glucose-1-phosphate thymidylyltransferase
MANWKGIILAGGTGSRLFPLTIAVNKHLLPVYDKPMIYYPLSTLMLSGIRDFAIISTPDALPAMEKLLGNGKKWGLSFEYLVQDKPRGIADAFRVAEDFLGDANVGLILGDNIIHGSGLQDRLAACVSRDTGATIFGFEVADPSAFGVITLDGKGKPISIVEKPKQSKSRLAIPGLYFFDCEVIRIARNLKPSARGELEVTDLLSDYLSRDMLRVERFGRGTAWLDGGTPEALYEATQFVKVVEDRSGLKIACPEEIAWRLGCISHAAFRELAPRDPKTAYDAYLNTLASGG